VPDGGGQGEDALQDPDSYSADGAAPVLFQVELALEGFVDRLDDLAQGLKNRAPARSGSPSRAGRSSLILALAIVVSKLAPK
jgi:hypothetical protein